MVKNADGDQLTERQRVEELLSYSVTGISPNDITRRLSEKGNRIDEGDVIKHIKSIRKSLRSEDEILAGEPPECQNCGFDDFRKILNIPSQCPECRSERLLQPRFKITDPENL